MKPTRRCLGRPPHVDLLAFASRIAAGATPAEAAFTAGSRAKGYDAVAKAGRVLLALPMVQELIRAQREIVR